MRAAPRTTLTFRTVINLDFDIRRMPIQILAVVCNPESGFLRFNAERMGQTQITKLEMVTIRLAVCRDVNQLSTLACSAKEVFDQSSTRSQCFLESDRSCEGSIVEEDCE